VDAHSFCRELLRCVVSDFNLSKKDFSVTKSSFGGYEVQGPSGFYHYANSADCKASALAEGMEHYGEQRQEVDLP
jgi:hypothetical protein